jgi:hypothetical protein
MESEVQLALVDSTHHERIQVSLHEVSLVVFPSKINGLTMLLPHAS